MKAARLEDGTLHIRDVEMPVPTTDQALVRISASGVCHSDLHIVARRLAGRAPLGRRRARGHRCRSTRSARAPNDSSRSATA